MKTMAITLLVTFAAKFYTKTEVQLQSFR